MNQYNTDKLKKGLDELGISYSDQQIEQLLTYYEMMIEKNKVMNLTSITEFDEAVEKHFLDSLSLVRVVSLHSNWKILDLGTGAGFPGIPLKIFFPELNMTLMDSLNKRVLFLREVIETLGLKNIEALHGRAEEMARKKEFREQFDFCVSRAVANIATLSEYCLPFVRLGGKFISYKSGQIGEEMLNGKKAVFLLGGKITEIDQFQVPCTELDRCLVVIDKIKGTPKTYPRKAGTPSKDPLK